MSEALERLVEKAGNPYRLGRHIELDERSLGYRLQQSPTIKPAEHISPIPILDQGNLGSCVGNAATRHLAGDLRTRHKRHLVARQNANA